MITQVGNKGRVGRTNFWKYAEPLHGGIEDVDVDVDAYLDAHHNLKITMIMMDVGGRNWCLVIDEVDIDDVGGGWWRWKSEVALSDDDYDYDDVDDDDGHDVVVIYVCWWTWCGGVVHGWCGDVWGGGGWVGGLSRGPECLFNSHCLHIFLYVSFMSHMSLYILHVFLYPIYMCVSLYMYIFGYACACLYMYVCFYGFFDYTSRHF